MTSFRDCTDSAAKWITFVEGEFFPDSIDLAIPIYRPVLKRFGELLTQMQDSEELLTRICAIRSQKQRVQLLRVFRKYVSPDTSVEMLKKKTKIPEIIQEFGDRFRDIQTVRSSFEGRPDPDEALIALLNEYRERGKKGYALTETFFEWFAANHGDRFEIVGPTGAGRDINLIDWLPSYPKDRRPVDFIITETGENRPLVIGLARYDSDRGGAQEDDRTSGYRNVITEVMTYSEQHNANLKLLFINDGPGLLLGSMWKDYCELEDLGAGQVMVATLRMLQDRLTAEWLLS